jgi:hypothetical protein
VLLPLMLSQTPALANSHSGHYLRLLHHSVLHALLRCKQLERCWICLEQLVMRRCLAGGGHR